MKISVSWVLLISPQHIGIGLINVSKVFVLAGEGGYRGKRVAGVVRVIY